QVAWPADEAPTEAEWLRAMAFGGEHVLPPRPERIESEEVLADLAARDRLSAAALEAYADCPVKWLVERLLDPEALEPDPGPVVRAGRAGDGVRDARLAPGAAPADRRPGDPRPDRPGGHLERPLPRARLQGREQRAGGREVGEGAAAPGGALHARRARAHGARAGRRRLRAAPGEGPPPARRPAQPAARGAGRGVRGHRPRERRGARAAPGP